MQNASVSRHSGEETEARPGKGAQGAQFYPFFFFFLLTAGQHMVNPDKGHFLPQRTGEKNMWNNTDIQKISNKAFEQIIMYENNGDLSLNIEAFAVDIVDVVTSISCECEFEKLPDMTDEDIMKAGIIVACKLGQHGYTIQ